MAQLSKKNGIVRQDNKVSESRSDFTAVESNVLYQAIRLLQAKYPMTPTNDGWIQKLDKIEDETIEFTADQLIECLLHGTEKQNKAFKEGKGDIQRRNKKYAFDALSSIQQKKCDLPKKQGEGWTSVNWFNYVRYIPEKNIYEVQISKLVVPYLFNLNKEFTKLDFFIYRDINNIYTKGFYQLGCRYKNDIKHGRSWDMSEKDLREKFKLDEYDSNGKLIKSLYKDNPSNFRRKVIIQPLQILKAKFEDPNDNCDFYIACTPILFLRGKTHPIKWRFTVHVENEKVIEPIKREALNNVNGLFSNNPQAQLVFVVSELNKYFPNDSKFVERVKLKIESQQFRLKQLFEKTNRIVHNEKYLQKQKRDRSTIPSILRTMINTDFGIQ